MAQGSVAAIVNHQHGARGASEVDVLSWAMLMAMRSIGRGQVEGHLMLSLDPATLRGQGYPLLLQTGETFRGAALHDRQHQHDFWMEVAGAYSHAVTRSLGVTAYAAAVGEPALGPVAFVMRPSAMDNPFAPIAHHWQDATHVSFGVLTGGVFGKRWKVEGSAFNAREPDPERWGFDPIGLGSASARMTVVPSERWAVSAGFGYLRHPELADPAESPHRATAALMYGATSAGGTRIAATASWGMNVSSSTRHRTHGALVEANVMLDAANSVFARTELVQKTARDLVIVAQATPPDRTFSLATASFGYVRDVLRWRGASGGVGVAATVNVVPAALQSVYGSRTPFGALAFFRLRPAFGSDMSEMPGMKMEPNDD